MRLSVTLWIPNACCTPPGGWPPAGWRKRRCRRSVLGEILRDLKDPINRYFTDVVLVMADDPELRRARLALAQRIAALPDGIVDLSQLQGF